MSAPRVLGVIPARFGSTRFPAKMLADLNGRPLIEWVWRGVSSSRSLAQVVVATDDERIASACRGFGAGVMLTPVSCPSGTDRAAAVLEGLGEGREWDWVVNVQGDEPLIDGAVVDGLVAALRPGDSMGTLARRLDDPAGVRDPNIVKVVTDLDGRALYFSRAPIPHPRDGGGEYWQHIGIYAYRPEVLLRLVRMKASPLEETEKLEQLRALQNGIAIRVVPTSFASVGVDVPEDLERVRSVLRHRPDVPTSQSLA